jgi:TPR repeat protein
MWARFTKKVWEYSPDYGMAAEWYRPSADQGYESAQINRGHLYEKGLALERDPAMAL